jgi:hypothetical protein
MKRKTSERRMVGSMEYPTFNLQTSKARMVSRVRWVAADGLTVY